MRVKDYVRKSMLTVNEWGEGAVGSLQWLFSSVSGAEIEAKFRKQILEKTRALESTKRSKHAHFRWLIEELRTRGYEERGEWPFNVARMGYRTICIFIVSVSPVHLDVATMAIVNFSFAASSGAEAALRCGY